MELVPVSGGKYVTDKVVEGICPEVVESGSLGLTYSSW